MKKIIPIICLFLFFFTITNYNNKEKKELETVINYQIENKDIYTPNSYNEYVIALNNAIEINKKKFASDEDINHAKENLQNKINNLYQKPDKSNLKQKYQDAINIDTNLYLPKSTTYLNYIITKTKYLIDDENATIEDIDNNIKQIDIAINELILKPDKSNLINLINQTNNLDKEKYTTESYNNLLTTINSATLILNDENATEQQVTDTIQELNNHINNLTIAKKGIYRINYIADMLSNNHVGNEWGYEIYYNDEAISNGATITAPINSNISIEATVIEYDKITDYGYSYIDLTLKDNEIAKTTVTVRENRGRYTGNIATWEITCYVNLIEILP